jgi:hypothetical protein
MYDDIYTTSQSTYTAKPKSAPAKKLTPQDQAAQKAFETTFSVEPQGKSHFDKKQMSDMKDDSETAMTFLEGWQNSPMYKQMLRNSAGDDYEVWKNIRSENLENIVPNYMYTESGNSDYFSQTTGASGIAGQSLGSGVVLFYPKNENETRQLDLPVHEYSHATDENGAFIPKKDIDLINSFKTDLKNTRGYINKSGESMDDAALKQLQGNYDYITDPTETRARLNALRYLGKQTGVYDPFTEKMDLEKFKMFNKTNSYFDPNNPNYDGNQPLRELREVYTDEEIIKMLNTISKNDDSKKEIDVAARGGELACPPGYIKVRGKCVKPQNMIMRNQMAPYVTNDINDPRLEAYKDSLDLHNQSLANHAEVRRNNMIPVFTNLPPNGSRRLYDRVLRNQTIKPEGYIHGERTRRTNPSVREVIYPVYKAPVQQVVYKPKSKKKTTKPVDKKPVIVEPVIQEEKQIETIPTLQPTYIEHPLNKFIETNNPGPGTDVMPQYAIDELPMYATPDGGAEWVGDAKRYIDWDGNSVGYNLPRVRKPGHGGDLIRKGKRRYLHLPSIETRYEAEIVPEEYARGGETDCPPGYAKDEFGDCIRVKTEKDVQLKPLWEKDRDKYGKDYISWYEAFNPKKWGLNDYSEYSSFNSAFRNARESGEDEFVYKGERYNTKQVPKKESDMYWKSKKFVEDYYKTQPYAKMDNDEKFMYNDEFIKKKYGTTWSELYNKQQNMDYNDPEYNKISKLMNQIFEEEQAITQNNHPEFDTYYKKNYVNKEKQERLSSLNKPTYFSITSQKPQDMSEDGYWDPQKNKMFLYTKADPGKFNSTYVHEVSHKADNFVDVLNSVPPINLKAFNDGPWSESFNQETYDYVSDPSEIEARKLSTLFYLSEHKTPWEAGKITQKTLDNLYRLADEDKLPYDIVQLLDLYGAQQDDLLKYLNGDYNYNYKPKNKEGGQHNVGDEVELSDAEVKRLRSLGYIIEQL